ncbi:MAG TPA: tetratricopeptide repeat protein [Myxococcota bacterium]|jgi:tetratricopeptide (TPR) repeat protein|nr:tetratricopeptide repeat protein [Myxococcota bacterium]
MNGRIHRLALAAVAAAALAGLANAGCKGARGPVSAEDISEAERLRRNIVKVNHSIEVTKSLIIAAKDRPYLPDLHLRLAELYAENARYHYLLAAERAKESGATDVDSAEATLSKNLAIATLVKMLDDFPKFVDRDKVLFLLGNEYRELGDDKSMLDTYEKLFAAHPSSKHVNEALIVVGDYYYGKKDFDDAEKYYKKVLDRPESRVHPIARHKMGYVYVNRLDYANCLKLMETIVRDKGTTKDRIDLRGEALLDLAYCFKEVRGYETATSYFRELAPSKEAYQAALAKLANFYYKEGNWNASAVLYRELLELTTTLGDAVDYGHRLYEAVYKAGDWKRAAEDVSLLTRVLNYYEGSWRYTDEDKGKLRKDYEVYARDISTKLHVYTKKVAPDVGEEGALSADSREKYAAVSAAYTPYLEAFPDSPKLIEMLENNADALYAAHRFLEAGLEYEKISTLAKSDPAKLKESVYNAVAAYFNALKTPEDLSRLDKVMAREGLRTFGRYYLKAFPDAPDAAQVKFNIARTYYDEGNYEAAVEQLSLFVKEYPSHKAAPVAGHLALDAYATLGNFEKLVELGKTFVTDARLDAGFRKEVAAIVKSAESRELAEVTLGAAGSEGTSAAEELVLYAEKHKGSGLGETALYNAFVKANESKDFSKIFEYGYEFVKEYPTSANATAVLGTLAKVSADVADFPRAALYLEEAYRRASGADAVRLMETSAGMNGALALYDAASRDYRLLMERLPAGEEKRAAAVKAASLYIDSGDWNGLERLMTEYLPIDPRAPQINFLMGYALYRKGNPTEATLHFQAAVETFTKGGDKSPPAIDAAGRAQFYLGEIALTDLKGFTFGGDSDAAETLEYKKAKLDDVESMYTGVLKTGSAVWAVAALARLAAAYQNFADFLGTFPIGGDVSADDRKKLEKGLAENIKSYNAKVKDTLEACAEQAKKLEVLTPFARACLEGRIYLDDPDAARGKPPRKGVKTHPAGAEDLRGKLLVSPTDVATLNSLGALYVLAGDYYYAGLILGKAVAAGTDNAATHHLLGVVSLQLNDPDVAATEFHAALEKDGSLVHTRVNLACTYLEYGYREKARAELSKVTDLSKIDFGGYDLHPGARACVSELTGAGAGAGTTGSSGGAK